MTSLGDNRKEIVLGILAFMGIAFVAVLVVAGWLYRSGEKDLAVVLGALGLPTLISSGFLTIQTVVGRPVPPSASRAPPEPDGTT